MAGRVDPAAYVRLVYMLGGFLFAAISWVWIVASRAKSCAGKARTEAAKAEVGIDGLNKRFDDLHTDVREGFREVKASLEAMRARDRDQE